MTILEILQEFNVPFKQAGEHHHTTHGFVNTDCPACSPDSGHYRLGFNIQGGWASCWSCGGLPALKMLAELTGAKYERLKEMLGPSHWKRGDETHKPRGRYTVPRGVRPMAEVHRMYLRKRGFDPEELEREWGLQGISLSHELRWRVFIPVHQHGEPVSWTTRSISDNVKSRYVNAKPEQESVNLKHLLYGADKAKHAVIVCEGPADVWRIGPGAVATFGLTYTPAQVLALSKFSVRAVMFDNERMAQRVASRLCDELAVFPGRTYKVSIDDDRWKDPGSISSEDTLQQLRDQFLT